MIFNFRIVSDEVDNFKREIKIDADATFWILRTLSATALTMTKTRCRRFSSVRVTGKKRKR